MKQRPFFEDVVRRNKLKEILDEWIGTPFRYGCGVKKLGCDCAHFVARVFEEVGMTFEGKGRVVPEYPYGWHLHQKKEVVANEIRSKLNVVEIDPEQRSFMDGDLFIFRYGLSDSHIGIYHSSFVYQVLESVGVVRISAKQNSLLRRLTKIFRVVEI